MKPLFIITALSLASLLFGQTPQKFTCELIDEEGTPVAFASVYFQNNHLGAMSDLNGEATFVLNPKYLPDTMVVNHIGYHTEKVYVLSGKESVSIALKTKNYELAGAVITALSAEDLVIKAIESIQDNYHVSSFYTAGNYRQIHKENGHFVRLIDAQVFIEHQGYEQRNLEKQLEKYSVVAMRRSFVYERNGDQHGDHLVDLMYENPIANNMSTILSLSNVGNYRFHYDTDWQEHYTAKVLFDLSGHNNDFNESGYVIIDKRDYAITEIEINSFLNPNSNKPEVPKSNWRFQNGKYKASYKKIGDVYVLEHCKKWYNHFVYNDQFFQYDYVVEETFEYWLSSVETDLSAYKFSNFSNLYSQHYIYDASNWLPEKFPQIPGEVVQDLSRYKSLEEQFAAP